VTLFANSEVVFGDFGHVRRGSGILQLQIEADVGALPEWSPHREQVQIANVRDGHVGHEGYVVVGNRLRLPHALQVTLATVSIVPLASTYRNHKKISSNKLGFQKVALNKLLTQ
jgi:hypothetical protein